MVSLTATFRLTWSACRAFRSVASAWLALGVALVTALPATAQAESRKWERLDNCRYEDNIGYNNQGANDADSFQVRCGKRQFVLRLYSVDAPEATDANTELVAEQAQSFGVSAEDVVRVGKLASKQVRRRLYGRDFTIWTRWAEAQGRSRLPRYYGVLEVDGGDLGQWLLSQGLARIKGQRVLGPHPGKAADLQLRHYRLEARARRERRGLWGGGQAVAASRGSS